MPKYRPHGTTTTALHENGLTRQIVTRRKKSGTVSIKTQDLPAFSTSSSDYLLSCYISVIDKIVKKPSGQNKPTRDQYLFRTQLGMEVWRQLPKDSGIDLKKFLERLHPYTKKSPKKECLAGTCRQDKKTCAFVWPKDDAPTVTKGRWYYSFFGKDKPKEVSYEGFGGKLKKHLLQVQRRRGLSGAVDLDQSDSSSGQIQSRARSAANSVLKAHKRQEVTWEQAEWDAYTGNERFNLPAKIVAEATSKELSGYQFGYRDAAQIIFDHYATVFTKPGADEPTKVRDLSKDERRVLNVHDAVRALYKTRLAGEKSARAAKFKATTAARHLPNDWDALKTALGHKAGNSDLMSLVRTGKLIHYTYDEATADLGSQEVSDVSGSPFLTSAGQEEIKRAESFVRVWRGVLGFSIHTLTDWLDPEAKAQEDILTKGGWKQVTDGFGAEATQTAFEDKSRQLFGHHANEIVTLAEPDRLELAQHFRSSLSDLRHSSFHFKGLIPFVKNLADLSQDAQRFASSLWQKDSDARFQKIAETFKAVDIFQYVEHSNANRILKVVASSPPREFAIPRLRRVLLRYENAWKGKEHASAAKTRILPNVPKRDKMEQDGALRCQYVCLKSIYETAFPQWLGNQSKQKLNPWIAEAQDLTSSQARKITGDDTVTSKVEKRNYELAANEDIWALFDRIGHDVATQNKPQNGYDPDEDKARANSEFLENFKRDVILLAFAEYLEENDFAFLEKLEPKGQVLIHDFDPTTQTAAFHAGSGLDWQVMLYALLHLVPVGQVSLLHQQFLKWRSLHSKKTSRPPTGIDQQVPGFADAQAYDAFTDTQKDQALNLLMDVLSLYLDMHDAKFIRKPGEPGLGTTGEIDSFFEHPMIGEIFFPDDPKTETSGKLPIRGLREVFRFGATTTLGPFYETHKISESEAIEFGNLESSIAKRQKKREDLHKEWVDNKSLPQDQLELYRAALADVSRHRILAGRVRLTDHVHLYRLTMQVLGRLQDYAGMWERDLYFSFLALCRDHETAPKEVLNGDGRKSFARGQIVAALRNVSGASPVGAEINARLQSIFNIQHWDDRDPNVRTRNQLSHYGPMRQKSETDAEPRLDLTALVNAARKLMAYDRKQKNNVSRSIIELLDREKLDLKWEMNNHSLGQPQIQSRAAIHLGGSGGQEALVSEPFVAWVTDLFGGKDV